MTKTAAAGKTRWGLEASGLLLRRAGTLTIVTN